MSEEICGPHSDQCLRGFASNASDRAMICCFSEFPISDSGFPNSEFRMAYAESGIPHHVLGVRGAHMGFAWGAQALRGRATGGWDIG